jgi:hypothetical protein
LRGNHLSPRERESSKPAIWKILGHIAAGFSFRKAQYADDDIVVNLICNIYISTQCTFVCRRMFPSPRCVEEGTKTNFTNDSTE